MNEIDELALYFGDDYHINQNITIHQPTVGEIVQFGEQRYWGVVTTLVCIPSDMISRLWEQGIDWEEVEEFELFHSFLSKLLRPEDTKILLGDLRLCDFKTQANEYGDVIMKNSDGVIIDANIYRLMTDAIRMMHGLNKKVRKAANSFTKELMIEVDRSDYEEAQNKPFQSRLKALVSSMINCAEFKYGLNEVRNMPYSAFMDSVNRVIAIKQAETLSLGGVCGMADLSKIPKQNWNWLRELDKE
jgi:hypothetical protein